MKSHIRQCFVMAIMAICLMSCSNSSELRFIGKNLSVPCAEFEKHLEANGFKHEGGHTYKGNYLGEEVGLVLDSVKSGHYTRLSVMLVTDAEKGRDFYEKLCKEVKKEHEGFKEIEKEENDDISYTQQSTGNHISIPTNNKIKEYSNGTGKIIRISCYDAAILTTVLAIMELDK